MFLIKNRQFKNELLIYQNHGSQSFKNSSSNHFTSAFYFTFIWVEHVLFDLWFTHYRPVLLFYTPWKHQKTIRFSDFFRVCRKATPGCNELMKIVFAIQKPFFTYQFKRKNVKVSSNSYSCSVKEINIKAS